MFTQGQWFPTDAFSRTTPYVNSTMLILAVQQWINSSKLKKQDYPFGNYWVKDHLQSTRHHCVMQLVAKIK